MEGGGAHRRAAANKNSKWGYKMKRLPTTIPGLDEILSGGLIEGGVYILEGSPGVGKTTMANQIAYTHARKGVKTLYVTMLAESHSRMLEHMEGQSFFRRQAVNSEVFYVSGYRELERDGLKAVVNLLRGELTRSGASLLIVDGLVVDTRAGGTEESLRRFVHELQSLVTAMTCTCLLLTSGKGSMHSAEQTMVDGIFAFEDHTFHWRAERRLQVRKFRGSEVIRGAHTFCITTDGLKFFPRLESLPLREADGVLGGVAMSTGFETLDAVLHAGGLLAGSSSAVVGDSGVGKTTFSLVFAAQGSTAEPSLFLACTEAAGDLERLADELSVPVAQAVESGALQIENWAKGDESLDEMGHKLLRLVDEAKVRRLVLDGLAGLADTLAFPERGYRFIGRLLSELKARRVTSVFTIDPAALSAAAGSALAPGVMGWFDNVLYLNAPGNGQPERILELRKVRSTRAKGLALDVSLPPV